VDEDNPYLYLSEVGGVTTQDSLSLSPPSCGGIALSLSLLWWQCSPVACQHKHHPALLMGCI